MDHILSELEKQGTNQNSFKCSLAEKKTKGMTIEIRLEWDAEGSNFGNECV
jgi:hypothetical protein